MDDGPVLQSLGVDEGICASLAGSGCRELVLQEMSGLADDLGYFCASEGHKIEGCHTMECFGVSILVASLWLGPVIALLDDVQACLETAMTVFNSQNCHDALFW